MKNEKTIVVIGGGYAGINLIEVLKKEFHEEIKKSIRIILVDKNDFHLKKVKLFKGIVNENVSNLKVPLRNYCSSNIEFIQGEVIAVYPTDQTVHISSVEGAMIHLDFDRLVLAMGSVVREVNSESGGITLNDLQNAKFIRQHLLGMMESPKSKLRLAIVGGGVTGIETAAEVGAWLKNETKKEGMKQKSIEIYLINNKQRILDEAPVKISERLENRLIKQGIHVMHNKRAEKFSDGKVVFSDKSELEADACIWTVGLQPHPSLFNLGLSLTEQGKLQVDSWYRLVESENIYAIGDCVHVVDPISGKAATMSCKEAISQAYRLSKIMKAHLQGFQANSHHLS
jgi:NADH:ubiquinone reductase (H+-translocating)